MSEKKVRNKFKEYIWDYYLTNRDITRQSDEYNRQNPEKGWSPSAKVYLVIIILGGIGIFVKYFIL